MTLDEIILELRDYTRELDRRIAALEERLAKRKPRKCRTIEPTEQPTETARAACG